MCVCCHPLAMCAAVCAYSAIHYQCTDGQHAYLSILTPVFTASSVSGRPGCAPGIARGPPMSLWVSGCGYGSGRGNRSTRSKRKETSTNCRRGFARIPCRPAVTHHTSDTGLSLWVKYDPSGIRMLGFATPPVNTAGPDCGRPRVVAVEVRDVCFPYSPLATLTQAAGPPRTVWLNPDDHTGSPSL
jgi:hypothetical protein